MKSRAGLRQLSQAAAMLAISGAAWFAPSRAADLPRLASMNVCTDQMLVALADPGQILGLSRFAPDGWTARDAQPHRILSGGAEDILVLHPDIVVASQFDKRSTRELLRGHGLHLVEFAVPRNLEEVRAQIREMGDITGHPDRAAREMARLDVALASVRAALAGRRFSVLPLSRRGWVAGSDSFIGSLLGETGLDDAAGDFGFAFGGFASLERIISLKPDLLLVSQAGDRASDEGQAFLLHPALERFYPPSRRIVVPERLTECGGVTLADALDVLAAELKRVGR